MSTVTIIRSLLKRSKDNLIGTDGIAPMTMQVGLVGSDGIVLAGDTRWTRFPSLQPNQLWSTGTHGTNASKIIVNYQRGIAVSAARDMEFALPIAREIAEHLPESNSENSARWIEETANRVLENARTEHGDSTERIEAHCLVLVTRPARKLFRFQFAVVDGNWEAFCQEMTRLAVAGDNVNTAIFWPEAYYNTFPYSSTRIPVTKLIPLAAHTITAAHRFSPTTISGLEVVFCDDDGIHRLSRDSLDVLESAVSGWDHLFAKTILNHSQDFTFDAPYS